MNFPFFIARRYFFAGKKTNFINIITLISMAGICVGSAALVIALSVFNGMEDLIRNLYGSFSSEIQIKPGQGKTFLMTKDIADKINKTEGVAMMSEVLEDNVLLIFKESQMVVKLRGTDQKILIANGLNDKIVKGELLLEKDSTRYALLGAGVQYTLNVSVDEKSFFPLEVVYPKNRRRINLNSQDSFTRKYIRPAGVFAIEQKYDVGYIFVPLSFAQEVFEAGDKRTFIEVKIKDGSDMVQVQKSLQAALGNNFIVQNRDEQNASVYKAIRIEKLFVSLSLSFIIAIVSFNIFFFLTMLALEKQKDLAVLQAMGATGSTIRQIFLQEGSIVGVTGTLSGVVLGVVICLVQQATGLVRLGIESAVSDPYPVKIELTDIAFTVVTVILITLAASLIPANRAAKMQDLSLAMKK
jgi:lipoprotein-releasing system permease protein